MEYGILVLKAHESGKVKVQGSYPASFVCPPKLLDNIVTNLDYDSFAPWGDVATDAGVALCKLETTELGKEYLICLVCDDKVDLRSASEFLNLIASKLALAENLGKLEENLPRLAPLVLENLSVLEPSVEKVRPTSPSSVKAPATGDARICPFRMSLPESQQACIREKCMAYFGDIGKASNDLNKALPKEGCYLIHGNLFRPAGLGTK